VKREFVSNTLFLLVIGLSLLVGWMVGRAGRRSAKVNSVGPGREATRDDVALPQSSAVPATDQSPDQLRVAPEGGGATDTGGDPGQGLVVYRNGKVVFQGPQTSPGHKEGLTSADAQPAAGKNLGETPALRISPEIAETYVAKRVEPEYPIQARTQGIQGPVVLDAWVGKDGSVQKLVTFSGNPQLVTAARDAVAQWKFNPLIRQGQPEEFQTRITVVFSLP